MSRYTKWAVLGCIGLVLTAAVAPIALEPSGVGPPMAPDPSDHPDPVVQVYGADVWGWRGYFAIHTWIAVKGRDADAYTNYQVIGWRIRRGLPALSVSTGAPDRPWFGSAPVLLLDRRGAAAEAVIDEVRAAVAAYPYADEYTMWPGPNSNSFTAWVALEVPKLGLDLPVKAIGQGWMKANYEPSR